MRDEVYEIEAREVASEHLVRQPPTLYSPSSSQPLCQAHSTQVCAENLPDSCIFDEAVPNLADQLLRQSAVLWGLVQKLPKQPQN